MELLSDNNNREVKLITWTIDGGESSQKATDTRRMFYREINMGDRTECWVTVHDAEGIELERHNARYIASIYRKE